MRRRLAAGGGMVGLVALAAALVAPAYGQAARPLPLGATLTSTVLPGSVEYYETDASSCRGWLHIEIWDEWSGGMLPDGQPHSAHAKADPMLMVLQGREPIATYGHEHGWSWPIPGTARDFTGYHLLRPYHHVAVDLRTCESRCDAACSGSEVACRSSIATCIATCDEVDRDELWFTGVQNVNVWMTNTLQYSVRAMCMTEQPCPAPQLGEGSCSGTGVCEAGMCVCDDGFGDVGCDKALVRLTEGRVITDILATGRWSYYQLMVPRGAHTLLVEMNRRSGDPVLFVKHWNDGFVPGGVPSVSDYLNFSDTEGFRSRLNTHHRVIKNVQPGSYYVAVFNNDQYINEPASYSLRAQKTMDPLSSLCAGNCSSPQGRCEVTSSTAQRPTADQCVCEEGYTGGMCQGDLYHVGVGDELSGVLQPSEWVFVQLGIEGDGGGRVSGHLYVKLNKQGGHPVLLLKRGNYPTMIDNDFVLSTTEWLGGKTKFRIDKGDLLPGTYILGLYNMDYYVHQECAYTLSFTVTEGDDFYNSSFFMSIILGIVSSVLLCFATSVCRRLVRRNNTAEQRGMNFIRGAIVQAAMGHHDSEGRHGLDPEVLSTIPRMTYTEGCVEKDDAACSVCLGEYEEGDMLRRMPPCGHVFHKACIDEWFGQHTTCPLCRLSLLPEDRQQGDGEATGTSTVAASGTEDSSVTGAPVEGQSTPQSATSVVIPTLPLQEAHATAGSAPHTPEGPAPLLTQDGAAIELASMPPSSTHAVPEVDSSNGNLSRVLLRLR